MTHYHYSKVVGTTNYVKPYIDEDLPFELYDETNPRYKELRQDHNFLKEYTSDLNIGLTQALLVPEPRNPYDPKAVMILVKGPNGKPFKIGYIPKESSIKLLITRPIPADLAIFFYSLEDQNLSDSYKIRCQI